MHRVKYTDRPVEVSIHSVLAIRIDSKRKHTAIHIVRRAYPRFRAPERTPLIEKPAGKL